MISSTISKCRLCDAESLQVILDLRPQPPANSLRVDLSEKLPDVPLVICRCDTCAAIQLTETVSPDYLFRDYVWVTGTSQTARDYSVKFYENVVERAARGALSVLEVASNDGTFLQQFRLAGHRVLGVDPAENLARQAVDQGIPTVAEFFGSDVARSLVDQEGSFDVVFARNVLPHVPDPNDVLAGMAYCLNDGGIGAIEFHWAAPIVRELHYDSIYHEHFFYHTVHSLQGMLERHGLSVFDVTESPISGGSLVVYFSNVRRTPTEALAAKLSLEDRQGLATLQTWEEFAGRAMEHRNRLRALIEEEISAGRTVVGYGASARSSTLLNFCGIDTTHLRYIADKSPHKHRKYTPGSNILIVSPESALAEKPDTILLLAWNFRDEILTSLAHDGFHGRVILPLPNAPHVVTI
jgi:SAM-dependent methyltransferase